MKVLVAALIGGLAAWLYRSERARQEVQRRLAAAPAPIREAAQSVASAAADRAERVAEVASVPPPVQDIASRAATSVRSAAELLGGGATAAPARVAALHLQELPDGSWVGNVAWGGRTLSDGAPDAQVVTRRLAARLAAMPEAGPPAVVKLTRVPKGGQREERESDLASLLG